MTQLNTTINTSIMKKIGIVILAISLYACGPQVDPNSIEGKRSSLKEKKTMAKQLKDEIAKLEEEILELDPPKEKAPINVNALQVDPTVFTRYVDVQASVTTDDISYASSETGGRLNSIRVKEGQYVKRGQLIATVDMQTLDNQIAEIQTSLDLATTVYDRQKRLWEQEIGSELQYIQAKSNKERLEKSLVTAQSQLSKRNVYAPISGVVEKEFMKSGEMSAPGSPIIQILNTQTVTITADVPEIYLGKIKRGDMVDIHFPALGITISRKITALGRTIDPANRTFEIEIETANRNGELKPNLLAEVKFKDLELKDVVVVPVDYVLEEVSGRNYVYIAKEDNGVYRAVKAYVDLGESSEDGIVIENGLVAGQLMITKGSRNVAANGMIIIDSSEETTTNG